jgi:hypothetical protein
MTRSICIYYYDADGAAASIEVGPPYDLFGTQKPSLAFWSLPRIKEIGIERLAELGVTDPVYFTGWDDMALCDREIELFRQNFASIDFNSEMKAAWLSHLTYCYCLLIEKAPPTSMPVLMIG